MLRMRKCFKVKQKNIFSPFLKGLLVVRNQLRPRSWSLRNNILKFQWYMIVWTLIYCCASVFNSLIETISMTITMKLQYKKE